MKKRSFFELINCFGKNNSFGHTGWNLSEELSSRKILIVFRPQMWTCNLSVFFYCNKAHDTIWNPAPTKNVHMYFVVVFVTVKKAHDTIWNPTPTKNVNLYFVVFFYCDKAHETIWNPTPTKNMNLYFVVFFYCEKGSRHHLEPYSQQKCAHVINLFFSYCEKAYGTIWNPNPTKKAHSSFSKFSHLT